MRPYASPATTRRLSSARLELASTRRLRIGLHGTVLVALLALSGTLALRLYTDGGTLTSKLHDLEARNVALEAERARLRTELALERATRSSLDRQVVALNERIAELSGQNDFRNAQRDRQRATQ
jgi:cell division protein FtsB